MTALPTDVVFASTLRPRRELRAAQSRPGRPASVAAGPRATTWVHVPRATSNVEVATVLALEGRAPRTAPGAEVRTPEQGARGVSAVPHYQWTSRGVAVLLALVAAAVAFMVGVLVTAFLAVSNEPIPSDSAPVALRVVAVDDGGR